MSNPIAIAISDLHLSLLQPACRADKDWLDVQVCYLRQVNRLSYELNPIKPLPVLCAGDIFDKWNAPPELINFALVHLPGDMICVPGQHDLPNHRLEDMHRCGYGVLKQVGTIRDISGGFHALEGFVVRGFGWGQSITPPGRKEGGSSSSLLKIALVHKYCWKENKSYPDAPPEAHVNAYKKVLNGFDVAVFGDNHLSFSAVCGSCNVLNPGGLLRRKSDEIGRAPCVGIIFDDGTVQRKKLDTSIDVFHDNPQDRPEVPLDLKSFIDSLEGLGEHGLNFVEAVENHLRSDDIDPQTKEIILHALQKQN